MHHCYLTSHRSGSRSPWLMGTKLRCIRLGRRTCYSLQVEQLHRIFKLCGSPSEKYWKKSKLPHATIFKPQQPYKRCREDTFKDFPPSSLPLIETLLAIDPAERGTATAALQSDFFATEPYACDPSSLPQYPPSKEMDAKLTDEEARRLHAVGGKTNADGSKKMRTRERAHGAVPAPTANAELQANLDVLKSFPFLCQSLKRRLITHSNAKSESEKFPPPHQDGAVGFPLVSSHHVNPSIDPPEASYFSTIFPYQTEPHRPGPVLCRTPLPPSIQRGRNIWIETPVTR